MQLTPIFSIKTLGDNKCYRCKIPFTISYPSGADYTACPICGWDTLQKAPPNWFEDNTEYYLYEKEDCDYCFTCNIIFRSGCRHAENGCTDGIDHAAFFIPKNKEITKFSDIQIPVFTSIEEADEFLQKEETKKSYEWLCLCKLHAKYKLCPRASYPDDTHPQYYNTCQKVD